jgi:hypothetical protein
VCRHLLWTLAEPERAVQAGREDFGHDASADRAKVHATGEQFNL